MKINEFNNLNIHFSPFFFVSQGGAEGVEKSAEEKAQELIDRTVSTILNIIHLESPLLSLICLSK